ncbi:MAG: DUF6279 family lipoprotein [Nitrospiraceae bacterium]
MLHRFTSTSPAIHPTIRRRAVWITSLAICLLLNGCAVSFVYRHADWLMLHKLDQYFDLTSEQRRDVTGRIQAILLKHRREALPQYEAFLVQVRQRVERGITREDVEWFYAAFDQLRDDLFERFVDDGGVFLASVGPAQKNTLARAMRKDNETAAKLSSGSARDRSKKQLDNTVDVVKDWTGFLTKDQRAKIVEWSQKLPDTQPMFFQYRQQRQQELLMLLERPRTPESAAQTLRAALVEQERTAPSWYLHAVQEWRDGIKDLVPKIDQTLSSSQRRYALDKLQRLIAQVRDLRG